MSDAPAIIPRISKGMRLPFFREDEDDPSPLSAGDMNKLVAVSNAMLNTKVVLGGRPDFNISERNAVITVPRTAGSAGSATGFFPFKIYRPSGTPAHTFRIRGGYVFRPEDFPANTTAREITTSPYYGMKLEPVEDGTDGVFTESDEEGSDSEDWILDNWDNGAAGDYLYHYFYLVISQDYNGGSPIVELKIVGEFHQTPTGFRPGHVQNFFVVLPGYADVRVIHVPIGFVTREGVTDHDLTASTITQLYRHSFVDHFQSGQARYMGGYLDYRVYWPGDIVIWVSGDGGDDERYVMNHNNPIINIDPNNTATLGHSAWLRINL